MAAASVLGSLGARSAGPLTQEAAGPEWTGIGLMLCIVGCFLLANGILFRHPRTMVAQHFGRKGLDLRTIREYVFHRVQMALGFAFLLAGFGVQLYGHARPGPAPGSTALWVGAIVLAVIVLELAGWWWSVRSLRRYVGGWLRTNPPDFETDTSLAREVGDLFGVSSHGNDTVQSYVKRVRETIGLPRTRTVPPAGAGRREPEELTEVYED